MSNDWPGWLYVAAVLIPLGAFAVQFLGLRVLGRLNAYIATGAILTSLVLSVIGLAAYVAANPGMITGHHESAGDEVAGDSPAAEDHGARAWTLSTEWVILGAGMGPGSSLPALSIPLAVHIDGLAAIMFVMVTFIASLIHIYSMGYMSEDPGYPRFFTFLSLFCFSMLGLVASATIFMVFIFWELVGVCSYLLIGFWYQDKANTNAANKAFIVNRVGDIGMLVGLGILWTTLSTFNISDINRNIRNAHGELNITAGPGGEAAAELRDRVTGQPQTVAGTDQPRQIPVWLLTLAGLGVFAGCVGKSAQFPLHVWLPDAMAGPTPVSALIHAATMVAAGVYLVGRFFPLFTADVLLYIAYTGAITLFLAATIACVQTDYKKVLAYSTVSQLGFMMLGLGVGGWAAGLFHLITHACFKALLFLGAGSVYHSVHTYEMRVLGGLRRKMPITCWTMLLATAAISGFPLLSGFFSKDAIMGSTLYFSMNHENPLHWLLFLTASVGATLTAFYMFRMWFLVFDGEPRGYPAPAVAEDHHGHGADQGHGHAHGHGNPYDHAHESPAIMTWPLILLAIPTVIIGWPIPFLTGLDPMLEHMLAFSEPLEAVHLGNAKWAAMAASVLIFVVGTALAAGYYSRWRIFNAEAGARRFGGVYEFLTHKWYFDELYDRIFVQPALRAGRLLADLDRIVIDGFLNGTARLTTQISRLSGESDLAGIDGLVNAVGRFTYALGDWSRRLQTGHLRSYLMVLAVGVVVLFLGIARWVLASG